MTKKHIKKTPTKKKKQSKKRLFFSPLYLLLFINIILLFMSIFLYLQNNTLKEQNNIYKQNIKLLKQKQTSLYNLQKEQQQKEKLEQKHLYEEKTEALEIEYTNHIDTVPHITPKQKKEKFIFQEIIDDTKEVKKTTNQKIKTA